MVSDVHPFYVFLLPNIITKFHFLPVKDDNERQICI